MDDNEFRLKLGETGGTLDSSRVKSHELHRNPICSPLSTFADISFHCFHYFQIAHFIILSLLPVAFSQKPLASESSNLEENVRVKRAGFSLLGGAIQVSISWFHCIYNGLLISVSFP
jgi:hypothetical protein